MVLHIPIAVFELYYSMLGKLYKEFIYL